MMGYLAAVPSGSKTPRKRSWTTGLPEKGELAYLWSWLNQLGVLSQGHEITFPEVSAWSSLTAIIPTPDEAVALVELSRRWLHGNMQGRDPESSPPWLPEL